MGYMIDPQRRAPGILLQLRASVHRARYPGIDVNRSSIYDQEVDVIQPRMFLTPDLS